MTSIENSGSPKTAPTKRSWVRRAVMGAAFAAIGMVTLGAATTPAQAWWYGGYGYHPYYAYYPNYYAGYGYPTYYGYSGWGYGWRGGWGWRHGYYHHW
jgi:hypothetical protein